MTIPALSELNLATKWPIIALQKDTRNPDPEEWSKSSFAKGEDSGGAPARRLRSASRRHLPVFRKQSVLQLQDCRRVNGRFFVLGAYHAGLAKLGGATH